MSVCSVCSTRSGSRFENSVASSDELSMIMAGSRSSSILGSGSGSFSDSRVQKSLRRVQKSPSSKVLMRLSSSDRYVLDYGEKFRDLMSDEVISDEAKCQRIYS